jgi:hypothetical protein
MSEITSQTGRSDMTTCNICGGQQVMIRGKNPGDNDREVCPTCLQERMDDIHRMTGPDYGVTSSEGAEELEEPEPPELTDASLAEACESAHEMAKQRGGHWSVLMENKTKLLHVVNSDVGVRYQVKLGVEEFFEQWTVIHTANGWDRIPQQFCKLCRAGIDPRTDKCKNKRCGTNVTVLCSEKLDGARMSHVDS